MHRTPHRVLVTGSEGLIGGAVAKHLRALGLGITELDLRAPDRPRRGDIRDVARLECAIDACDGVVHLAAVSRVVWAEQQQSLCWDTNVGALQQLLQAALVSPRRPWLVFASSREVYGDAAKLPATEDNPLQPVNLYGRSKVAGEALCAAAAAAGLRVAIVRLSNVFGSRTDHPDRVVPAFIRAALAGEPLRVDGAESTFDFTYLDDAVSGLTAVVDLLSSERQAPPPLHLVTGVPTSLGHLAATVVRLSASASRVIEAPPRSFDVARFFGDPSRAHALLGWRAAVPLQSGLVGLIAEFREHACSRSSTEVAAP
jgi:UDP-glucose 4-epimerase